jgi:hypothetical protein
MQVRLKGALVPEENIIPPTAKSENPRKSGALPEIIPVKYTEEEAEYLSMRPLVRQEFRSAELVDMIVQVAGKDPLRVQKILGAGTIVFHSFRYWWTGFEADAAALSEILTKYPDADPQRIFRAEDCNEVILESCSLPATVGLSPVTISAVEAGKQATSSLADLTSLPSRSASPAPRWPVSAVPPRHSLRIRREGANKRKLLRSRSVWEILMNITRESTPVYRGYSYSLGGDISALPLSPERAATLARDAMQVAPRVLRAELAALPKMSQIIFICPRPAAHSSRSPI